MIKVKFETSEDGKSLILSLEGHAGYADKGQDIVCSAATMLAYTIAQVVTDLYNAKRLRKKPTIHLEEGNATVVCKPSKEAYAEALHAYHVVEVGYNLLANNYPEFVKIKLFGQAIKPLK